MKHMVLIMAVVLFSLSSFAQSKSSPANRLVDGLNPLELIEEGLAPHEVLWGMKFARYNVLISDSGSLTKCSVYKTIDNRQKEPKTLWFFIDNHFNFVPAQGHSSLFDAVKTIRTIFDCPHYDLITTNAYSINYLLEEGVDFKYFIHPKVDPRSLRKAGISYGEQLRAGQPFRALSKIEYMKVILAHEINLGQLTTEMLLNFGATPEEVQAIEEEAISRQVR